MTLRVKGAFVLLVLAFTLATAGATGQAAPETSELLTLRDHRSDIAWTIEASSLAREAGRFSLRVPQVGVYLAVGRAELSAAGNSAIRQVRYEGAADLVRQSSDPLAAPAVTRLQVRLEGHVDVRQRSGEAKLWAGADRYHLVAPRVSGGPSTRTLGDFERALLANDWRALYALSNSDLTSSYSIDEFAAAAAAQQASVGEIAGLRRLRVGEAQTNPAGLSFAVAGYEIAHRRSGTVGAAVPYDVYWVLEGGEWRIWFSARR